MQQDIPIIIGFEINGTLLVDLQRQSLWRKYFCSILPDSDIKTP